MKFEREFQWGNVIFFPQQGLVNHIKALLFTDSFFFLSFLSKKQGSISEITASCMQSIKRCNCQAAEAKHLKLEIEPLIPVSKKQNCMGIGFGLYNFTTLMKLS